MNSSLNYSRVLSNDELRRQAPSVFAVEPWHKMSERYTFIPTITIIDRMRQEGFQPVSATQSRTRIPGKSDFTKHMIRFRDMRNGDVPAIRELGMIYPEIMLTNSHDGASAYTVDASLMRLICLNGLVVSAGNMQQVHVRHQGGAENIIEASYEVVDQFPKVIDSVHRFSQLRLEPGMQNAFADAALTLRYEEGKAPISTAQLLAPRRREDAEPTLWNTLNMVQEHMIQGGLRGRSTGEGHRRIKTRAVTGISENTKLNKAIWQLGDAMADLLEGKTSQAVAVGHGG